MDLIDFDLIEKQEVTNSPPITIISTRLSLE